MLLASGVGEKERWGWIVGGLSCGLRHQVVDLNGG